MNYDSTENPNPIIPRQKLNSSKKGEKWGKANVDGIIGLSSGTYGTNGRTSRTNKLENYDLVNSIFNKDSFKAITNRYNLDGKKENIPVQMFNIIRNKIEFLKGEEMKRPFQFQAVGIDGEVIRARDEVRKKLIRENLIQILQAQLGEPQVDEQGNPIPQPEIETILKDFDKNWKDIREKWVNDTLQYLKRRENLELKFNEGVEHVLIAGEEIYYCGISKGEPQLRVVNPVNFEFDRTPNMSKIQDAEWAVEKRVMSKSQILDEYEEYLSKSDLDKLDSDSYNSYLNRFTPNGTAYYVGGPPGVNTDESILAQGWGETTDNLNEDSFSRGHFSLYCVTWKSWKKIGFLSYIDENGEPQVEQVDDTFKLEEGQEEQGWAIEWSWVIEVWKGYKIPALDIYFGIEPLENQVHSELPYVGRIYSAVNSECTSIVDLLKPYQHIHSMTWHKVKQETAKAKGMKMTFDLANMPKSEGWGMDKVMQYFDEDDILFFNSAVEGRENDPTAQSRANQTNSFDMGMSSTFGSLLTLLEKIEFGVDSIAGIPRQREGSISASETATNVGRVISQSSNITEPLFYIHNECKVEVLNHLVKIAQIAYRNGKSGQFIMDDKIKALEIDGEMLNDSEYQVFITGSASDRQVLENIRGLVQVALQADKINLSDVIEIYKATSISEVETKIIAGEQDKIARDQAAQENANNVQLQQQAMVNQGQKEAEDRADARAALERENKLNIARISQLGLNDTDNDGTIDILELENIKIKNSQHEKELAFEEKKLAQQKAIEDKKDKRKQEEIAVKKIAANKKPSSKK